MPKFISALGYSAGTKIEAKVVAHNTKGSSDVSPVSDDTHVVKTAPTVGPIDFTATNVGAD